MSRARRVEPTIIFLELLVAACALIGGGFMISDPSGALLGLSPRLLEGLPFRTFLVPGLVMVAANAVLHHRGDRGTRRTRGIHRPLMVGLLLRAGCPAALVSSTPSHRCSLPRGGRSRSSLSGLTPELPARRPDPALILRGPLPRNFFARHPLKSSRRGIRHVVGAGTAPPLRGAGQRR